MVQGSSPLVRPTLIAALPLALGSVHRGKVDDHARRMERMDLGGQVVAGIVTLAPRCLRGNFAPKGARVPHTQA
ncbi:hypothetical protein BURK1_00792 [Burkholderiales bacterium]|nr:hypothetical protein BURK1_00792 [Burkholderiales bacterium]